MTEESLLSLLVKEAAPILRDGFLTYIATRTPTSTAGAVAIRMLNGEPPLSVGGCPYCSCVKLLATAHRYLLRGATKPQLADVYQQLASYSVKEVLLILEDSSHSVPRHVALVSGAMQIDILMAIPLSPGEMKRAAQKCSDATEIALDLAEWFNSSETTPPATHLPARDVIEGEGRVVS